MTEKLNLTDQNFGQIIQTVDKPVLIDFWAQWCQPCFMLAPILEKVAEEFKDKIILAKVNLDNAQGVAQKFGIDKIPTVMLFEKGKPVGRFVGVRPEPVVRDIINQMLEDVRKKEGKESSSTETSTDVEAVVDKSEGEKNKKEDDREKKEDEQDGEKERIEETIKWYEDYAAKNEFRLNPDRTIVERLIKGLLTNKKEYGARYCPCRSITGNLEEDKSKICPCQWHKEEIEKDGHCFCGLFAKK